ncbi:hypothetical protein BDM02DRAFT_3110329 [Thelephora ganbajun]|uniref:Uncharacterized protein n=1 Tax=Thelephora ganbajun TaxID=370292 RepID=A0ACB6ZPB0_THEGA|nr:hypothetical protein BDM02DRAFT_3110329 [Thelephora ganbajun]
MSSSTGTASPHLTSCSPAISPASTTSVSVGTPSDSIWSMYASGSPQINFGRPFVFSNIESMSAFPFSDNSLSNLTFLLAGEKNDGSNVDSFSSTEEDGVEAEAYPLSLEEASDVSSSRRCFPPKSSWFQMSSISSRETPGGRL